MPAELSGVDRHTVAGATMHRKSVRCRHLRAVDRQGTSQRSNFLDACRAHNAGELSENDLIETTRRLGFQNVIDAFHALDGVDIDQRFFLDERSNRGGIRLTDQMHRLLERQNEPR